MPMNALSGFTLVASNGQVALVPSLVMPANTKETKKRKAKASPTKKPVRITPVPIRPYPAITIAIPPPPAETAAPPAPPVEAPAPPAPPAVNEKVDRAVATAVNEAIAGFNSPVKISSPVKPSTSTQVAKSAAATSLSAKKPFLKIRRRKMPKKSPNHRLVPAARQSSQERPKNTPRLSAGLEDLLKIARKACVDIDPSPDVIAETEPTVTTPSNEPGSLVSTPTSTRRRNSHIRQLNFGESPDLPPAQPKVMKTISAAPEPVPWDAFLRTAAIVPEPRKPSPTEDEQIFATPKGKAKRTKKVSPTGPQPSSTDKEEDPVVASTSAQPVEPSENAIASETAGSVSQTDGSAAKEDGRPAIPVVGPDEAPTEPVRPTTLSLTTNFVQPSSAASSGVDVVFQQPGSVGSGPPVLATPRKEEVANISTVSCDGQMSSSSFGAWFGEIPRTPQIHMDLTNSSSSPFLVSYTKGFSFLPTAESPSLAVPATPSISGFHSASSSIETPIGFYQYPSTLNTPRY